MKGNSKAGTPTQERTRYSELKRMLETRRRELQAEVQGKIRDVRAEGSWGGKLNEVLDAVESSEVDIQDDFGLRDRERASFSGGERVERPPETDEERRRRQREDRPPGSKPTTRP